VSSSRLQRLPDLIAAVCIFAFIAITLGASARAQFEMIDDHQILRMVGPSGRVSLGRVPALVVQMSAPYPRSLPLLHSLRAIEAYAWGLNPYLWHLARLAMGVASALLLYAGVRALLPTMPAALVALLLFSGRQTELWLRLGNGEVYGCLLLTAGLFWTLRRIAGRTSWSWAELLPGLVLFHLAGYAKESFIPVLPAAVLLLWACRRAARAGATDENRRRDWVALLALGAGVLLQGVLVLLALRAHGHVYARALALADVLHRGYQSLGRYAVYSAWPLFMAIGGGHVVLSQVAPQRKVPLLALPILALAGLAGPQWLVYSGDAIEGRYLVPGNFFGLFVASWAFWTLYRLEPHRALHAVAARAAALAVATACVAHWGFRQVPETGRYVHTTWAFQDRLSRVTAAKRAHPEWPIALRIKRVNEYENAFSVRQFLLASTGEDRPFLFVEPSQTSSRHEQLLQEHLTAISLSGSAEFRPRLEWPSSSQCIEVVLSSAASASRCRVLNAVY
jgi:hypothetical protein